MFSIRHHGFLNYEIQKCQSSSFLKLGNLVPSQIKSIEHMDPIFAYIAKARCDRRDSFKEFRKRHMKYLKDNPHELESEKMTPIEYLLDSLSKNVHLNTETNQHILFDSLSTTNDFSILPAHVSVNEKPIISNIFSNPIRGVSWCSSRNEWRAVYYDNNGKQMKKGFNPQQYKGSDGALQAALAFRRVKELSDPQQYRSQLRIGMSEELRGGAIVKVTLKREVIYRVLAREGTYNIVSGENSVNGKDSNWLSEIKPFTVVLQEFPLQTFGFDESICLKVCQLYYDLILSETNGYLPNTIIFDDKIGNENPNGEYLNPLQITPLDMETDSEEEHSIRVKRRKLAADNTVSVIKTRDIISQFSQKRRASQIGQSSQDENINNNVLMFGDLLQDAENNPEAYDAHAGLNGLVPWNPINLGINSVNNSHNNKSKHSDTIDYFFPQMIPIRRQKGGWYCRWLDEVGSLMQIVIRWKLVGALYAKAFTRLLRKYMNEHISEKRRLLLLIAKKKMDRLALGKAAGRDVAYDPIREQYVVGCQLPFKINRKSGELESIMIGDDIDKNQIQVLRYVVEVFPANDISESDKSGLEKAIEKWHEWMGVKVEHGLISSVPQFDLVDSHS